MERTPALLNLFGAGEGKASRPSRETVVPSTALSGESSVLRRLDRIKDRAEHHPQEVFTNLFSLLTIELQRLIERFRQAGVMIASRREETDDGVPQGSVLSPLLANVYLHDVLDLWFEREVQPRLQGEASLVRYADDFICTFEYESDARRFQDLLVQRLGDFSLELVLEKSKRLRFGRFAERDSARLGEGRAEVFDFLGFTHYCGLSRASKFKLKRRTSKQKLKGKLREMKDWLRRRLTVPLREVWPLVNAKLAGHFQYYNVNDNWESLELFRRHVSRLCFRWMRRRSQKGKTLSWRNFYDFLSLHPLVSPKQITDLIAMAR